MVKLKKLLSLMLAIALLVSSISITSKTNAIASETTVAWQQNGIIAPEDGKLIGAGYIDIVWDNTIVDAKQYVVYVDGKKMTTVSKSSSEKMKYEMYTTQVSAHTAEIAAILTNGSVVSAKTTFYVTKKGICVNTRDMGSALDPADLNLGWYYNWGTKSFKELEFSNEKFYDLEFVPMIYSDGKESINTIMERANEQGYKYMLGYNEPDLRNEANKSPSTAILRWNDFVKYKGALKLGSPAISTAKAHVDSTDWWHPYWNGLSASGKYNTSFIALHRYYEYYNGAETAQDFLRIVDETYDKYKKPIWITEFALWRFDKNDAAGCAKAQEFMKVVIKGLNERSFVERYSWFSPSYEGTEASSSAVFVYNSGEITPIGKIYAELGNPAGYKAKTYGVNSSTTVDTSTAGCIKAMKATDLLVIAKKKKFKYDIKKFSNIAGYEIQYGTKKSMKGAKKKTVKKAIGTIKITLTKKQKKQIKKNKKIKRITYYVRARGYKILGGKKYYLKWSPKQKAKIKVR